MKKGFVILTLIIGVISAQDSWTTKANMPTAREGLAIGVVNGKIYAIGGYDLNSFLSVNEEYDPATDIWTTKASMPTARSYFAIGVVNDKIYAIGGSNGSTYLSVNEEYDPLTDTWTTKSNMPTPRNTLAIGVVNNKIYAMGGRAGSPSSPYISSANEEYDPSTDTWTTKTDMPTPREFFAIGVVNNKIYAIGGFDGYTSLSINEEYDPLTDTWTSKTDMPTARYALSAGVVNNKIYGIGGYNGNNLSTNEEYDPFTDTWTTKTNMPTARWSFAIGVVNDKIYAIGGVYESGWNWIVYSKNEEYDPGTVDINDYSESGNRKSMISLYPAIVNDYLTLYISRVNKEKNTIRIIDPEGRILYKKKLAAGKGKKIIKINISGLKSGIYFLNFDKTNLKFLKK